LIVGAFASPFVVFPPLALFRALRPRAPRDVLHFDEIRTRPVTSRIDRAMAHEPAACVLRRSRARQRHQEAIPSAWSFVVPVLSCRSPVGNDCRALLAAGAWALIVTTCCWPCACAPARRPPPRQTRQRPQLVFDTATGVPLLLLTAGSFEGNNPDMQMLTHTCVPSAARRLCSHASSSVRPLWFAIRTVKP
jgi:hypothetical protein